MTSNMPKPSQAAIDAAAQIYVDAMARVDSLTPHQAAVEAHVPGGPTVAELEQRIRADRQAATQAPRGGDA